MIGKEVGMARQSRKTGVALATYLGFFLLTGNAAARSDDSVETIVFVRHGEKPSKGLGQLNCKGLNRALALPSVIAKLFGPPKAVFAPDPSDQKVDDGESYSYVRPLATIEPTAISFGLPVNANIGVSKTEQLQVTLEQPRYRNELVLVAWEHKLIETAARALLAAHGGDATAVPKWSGDDFDSIYVVTITWTGETAKASFAHKQEGLDGQSDACPH
jgi:hypothetical protein